MLKHRAMQCHGQRIDLTNKSSHCCNYCYCTKEEWCRAANCLSKCGCGYDNVANVVDVGLSAACEPKIDDGFSVRSSSKPCAGWVTALKCCRDASKTCQPSAKARFAVCLSKCGLFALMGFYVFNALERVAYAMTWPYWGALIALKIL